MLTVQQVCTELQDKRTRSEQGGLTVRPADRRKLSWVQRHVAPEAWQNGKIKQLSSCWSTDLAGCSSAAL